jgi:hypothetical protein
MTLIGEEFGRSFASDSHNYCTIGLMDYETGICYPHHVW